ncbi:MAG: hypothetical protein M3O36_19525 [Myxococcota bacterium]|nr:hypothetical protein [Myxococcota bacterium]
MPHWAVHAVALLGLTSTASACGRRATHGDCQLIVDKSVELQMKALSRNDPGAIAKREAQVRAELGDEIKNCESRHVTDKTMACIQASTTADELEKCLR